MWHGEYQEFHKSWHQLAILQILGVPVENISVTRLFTLQHAYLFALLICHSPLLHWILTTAQWDRRGCQLPAQSHLADFQGRVLIQTGMSVVLLKWQHHFKQSHSVNCRFYLIIDFIYILTSFQMGTQSSLNRSPLFHFILAINLWGRWRVCDLPEVPQQASMANAFEPYATSVIQIQAGWSTFSSN